jgi:catechol 2,3-dioxygenase-like lactoylglutathione lyase family enzyme
MVLRFLGMVRAMPILDHIGLAVANLDTSIAFYKAALAPLGIEMIKQYPGFAAGFGTAGKPDFWVGTGGKPSPGIHVAFVASGRAAVRAFYEAAMAAGGKDNGAPGVRERYHANYYGAFVLDPDGYNVEAVCHEAYLG